VVVPPPHEYFFHFLYAAPALNSALHAFISDSFSEEFKQRISETWGLVPSKTSSLPYPPPFETNPLLRLQFARWRETVFLFTKELPGLLPSSLSNLRALCLTFESPSLPSPAPHATMRLPRDPLLPSLQRLWFDAVRVWSCHLYAYATPTPQAIDALLRCAPLVEVGAGTGYWTSLVEQRAAALRESGDLASQCGVAVASLPLSLVIQAFDKDPPTSSRANSYHGRSRAWSPTLSAGNATDSLLAAHRQLLSSSFSSPDLREGQGQGAATTPLSLLLCYPPPDSDMALRSLRQYLSLGGQTVAHVGEYRGDTGTRPFERLLETVFDCQQEVLLPNWGDTAYALTIWRRRAEGQDDRGAAQGLGEFPHPCRRCSVCGGSPRQMHRCRVSAALSFCGAECAGSVRARELYSQEMSYRCLLWRGREDKVTVTPTKLTSQAVSAVSPGEVKDGPQPSQGSEMHKKRKKRRKPSLLDEQQAKKPSSDAESSDEDIRSQLKRYRAEKGGGGNGQGVALPLGPPAEEGDKVVFSSQWFMAL
jgi:hypothetical protein